MGGPVNTEVEGGSSTSTIELTLSCRNLINKDLVSKSDPMAVIYHKPVGSDHWVELVRTEVVQNDLNADFATKATMEYYFEERQPIRIEIYDVDKPSDDLEQHDFMGYSECTLAMVVATGPSGFTTDLKKDSEKEKVRELMTPRTPRSRASSKGDVLATADPTPLPSPSRGGGFGQPQKKGEVVLIAEELSTLKDEATIKFAGNGLGKPTCFCLKPKIFYLISRSTEGGSYIVAYRSECASGPSPTWPIIALPLRTICKGDRDLGLKIECFQQGNNPISLGYCLTTLNKMMSLGTGGFPLVDSDGTGKLDKNLLKLRKMESLPATLVVMQCKIGPIYTFLDYIQHGTQVHCVISIDFTASNGNPSEADSLHYTNLISANDPNPYEQAIMGVGTVLEDYDSDRLIPVYGFGARIPPQRQVSHNFYVTLNQDSCYCYGIAGILENYRICISKIELYAPTNFSPVIKHVSEIAAKNLNGENYFVLMIITDGVITDMPETKEAIVDASDLPMSIVVVGVGDEDFSSMEYLDGDSVRISFKGRKASRDIVQFVPYRNAEFWMNQTVGKGMRDRLKPINPDEKVDPSLKEKLTGDMHRLAQSKLAKEVLAEIPAQFTEYMKSKGITPGNIGSTQFVQRLGA